MNPPTYKQWDECEVCAAANILFSEGHEPKRGVFFSHRNDGKLQCTVCRFEVTEKPSDHTL